MASRALNQGSGGDSGPREPDPSSTGSGPSGIGPGRVAPPGYQAEVLRGQLCDDLNRRFWRARLRLARAFDDRKEQVARDFERMAPDEFLSTYNGWRFL